MTDTTTAGTETQYVDAVALNKITTHPDNPRHVSGDVADLAISIKESGVLEPLVVVPFDSLPDDIPDFAYRKGAEYCLIAGHRRLAAAKDAGVKTVPVLVRHDLTSRDAQVAAMVIENQHRADLTPIEEGEAYQLLLDVTPKATQTKVAKAVGMPKRRVSERVRLTKLGDTAKTAVHDGQITLTDALTLLDIEHRHPALAEKAALAAGTKDFNFELNRAGLDANTLDKFDQYRDHAEDIGTPVLEAAPGYGPDAPRRVGFGIHGLEVSEDGTTPDHLLVGSAHAECPGAAVYIPKQASGVYELGWYCTEYAAHHTPTKEEAEAERAEWQQQRQADMEAATQARLDAMTDEERAEEQRKNAEADAAAQARQERYDSLKAAQRTRWAHFAAIVQQGDVKLAKWAMADLLTTSLFEDLDPRGVLARALLSVAEDADEDAVTTAITKLSLNQQALLMWFLAHEWDDDHLVPSRYDTRAVDVEGEVAHYLTEIGGRFAYEWSSVELAEFGLDRDDDQAGDAA